MKKITSVLAASTAAVLLTVAPTIAANASADHAAASHDYTLHVTAKGGANIEYIVISNPKSAAGVKAKIVHTSAKHWHHSASSTAELVEIVAHQRHGSSISCSITDHSGHVLSTSTGHGRNAIASCIVTTQVMVAPGS